MITAGIAGDYFVKGSEPAENQALAALCRFFDVLVERHAVALNPSLLSEALNTKSPKATRLSWA